MDFKLILKPEFDRVLNSIHKESDRLHLFAEMCRFNTLVAVKKAGSGHLGSSFSAADITTFLYLKEMNVLATGFDSPDRDIYFSSKGHDVPGLYSLFYALGILPAEKLLMLRRLHGLDGHPEVRITGIEASTGSLGMGIAKGKGMAWAKKYKNYGGHVYVMTGDGEFQEGQIWESLQATAHQKVCNLTVIMDHNKFQTDMLVTEVNNIEDLKEKISAFGWHVVEVDGHDYDAMSKVFAELKSVTDKPKFVIGHTIKGRGVSFMEERIEDASGKTFYKWHSGAPDDDSFSRGLAELRTRIESLAAAAGLAPIDVPEIQVESSPASKSTKEFVTDAFGATLVEVGAVNDRLVVLDGDLSADCKLRKFEYTYPDRFIENGIAEQDMVSTAGGLARMGLIPVVNSFASFLVSRANEHIYNNATEGTKIIYGCHFAGMIPAGPGKSHQSVRDISLLTALPNVTIVQPCNGVETAALTRYCINDTPETCFIRLVIGPSPETIQFPNEYKVEPGKGTVLVEGKDAVLFAYGPVMLHEALLAAEYLKESGFALKVVNMPWLNKVDTDWLLTVTSGIPEIFVLEDHSIFGSLGDRLLYALTQSRGLEGKFFTKLGLEEYPECGTPWEVLEFHGLDGRSLANRISGKVTDHNSKDVSDSVLSRYTEDAPQ